MQLARKAGLTLRIDGKFGSDHYHSVTGSWPALIRFACSISAKDLTAEVFDIQQAGFERCFEALGIADDRERSWSSLVLALTGVATDAARYRFIRDDNDWHQSDRYWTALSAGGELLDKTIDAGIKDRAEAAAEGAEF